MSGFLLLIDDADRLKAVVEEAVVGANVKVVTADSFAMARRKLIQAAPNLIISAASLKTDLSSDGFGFCKDLKAHTELSRIPVILVGDQLTEERIRAATESGASGLLPWPLTPAVLRARIAPVLPELLEVVQKERAAQASVSTSSAAPSFSQQSEAGEKLALAQRLLAQVLHNLKTSDLLQVADLEDVPRIVSEMTRSVCGVGTQSEEQKPPRADSGETLVDLDSAFRFKG